MGYFLKCIKIKWKIVGETDTDSEEKKKKNNQYLNLKFSWHDQRSILIWNTTGLKLIPRQ